MKGFIDDFISGNAKEATEESECADTMCGVFKVYAVSFTYSTTASKESDIS